MNVCKIVCLALAANVLAGNAWSAEIAGRITYISADHKLLMLDNSRMYRLENSSEAAKVAVGERAELMLDAKDSKEATDIDRLS